MRHLSMLLFVLLVFHAKLPRQQNVLKLPHMASFSFPFRTGASRKSFTLAMLAKTPLE